MGTVEGVVSPRPEVGSLYVDYGGRAIRLVDYVADAWGQHRSPVYACLLVRSESTPKIGPPHEIVTTLHALPEGARLVWSPTGGPR